MRISSQVTELSVKQATTTKSSSQHTPIAEAAPIKQSEPKVETLTQQFDKELLKGKLEPAIQTVNEVLETTKKSSKFVLHEGLDKYYVRLVDSETEEVIKEIPPERLLDAFYELQKLAGMIVDEKI